ncbi:L-threonine 3-dehydrogenase [Ornithinimicrobium sp. CNJ-824]|jgi:threonine 3-dehydrogenase|uniref:L-threonine 3-dehydrogenase n=1 Tax=Ornithinimicrobium sp. CNJ-824 TaxID=1904966 RepID=UPI0009592F39|nr:L-threonine 3-dehydrogenase [Ornithinimicrobium sp. CNJ-824]OLT22368.1 L-threonine 3-dehydrogenase [Ornithinimicrobium sp. CNJ-824]
MRALVKPRPGPGLELMEVPEPSPGPGEVKIRVLRAGLCGTDLHIESWDDWAASMLRPPLVVGHEFYGEVVEVGEGVPDDERYGLRPGQRVSVEGHVVCGHCRNCRAGRRHMCVNTSNLGVNRDGCFADYVVVPHSNVWVQPDLIDPDLGAVFDPLGNAVHTALSFPLEGEDVLITGAGPIGVMAAAVVRHAGARHVVVTDVSAPRLKLAAAAGADLVLDVSTERIAEAQERLGMTEGFDVVLEMSGNPRAMAELIDNCTHGARVAMLGLPSEPYAIDWGKVITHMITLKGIYGREMYETWYKMTAMLQTSQVLRDRVRSVITHRFPAEQWQDAFDAARSGEVGKVILDWS